MHELCKPIHPRSYRIFLAQSVLTWAILSALPGSSCLAMDFLKSAVASAISKDPPFPYKFGDRLTVDQSIWALYNGTKRVCVVQQMQADMANFYTSSQEDGSDCSIFAFDITADRSRLPLARNAVRKMRTLRHPGVIRVYDTVEVSRRLKKKYTRLGSDLGDRPKHTSMWPRNESLLWLGLHDGKV